MSEAGELWNVIYEALNARAKELYDSDVKKGEWTESFKKTVYGLGKRLDFCSWGTRGHGIERSEWLWDVSWAKIGKDWKDFHGLALACEIEWTSRENAILSDFLKLVVARADHLLFIFTSPYPKAESWFDKLQSVSAVTKGSSYMAIAVPHSGIGDRDLPYRTWST